MCSLSRVIVTHAGILTRPRSTTPYGMASPRRAALVYHWPAVARRPIRRFGVGLIPDHLRRRPARPVSYYALFKWWLLLSQHPGCHRRATSSRTEPNLGTLADGLGCFRLDRGHYRSRSHSRGTPTGIRSLVEARRRVAPRPLSVALPPVGIGPRLPLKAFRREPDISPFD